MNVPLTFVESHLPCPGIIGRGVSEALATLCQGNAWLPPFLGSDAGVGGRGHTQMVSQALREGHLLGDVSSEVPPEPRIEVLDNIAERSKTSGPAVVVALDGGGVMDAAKVAAPCARREKTAREFLGFRKAGKRGLPTMLTSVSDEMGAAQKEIFGPVIPLFCYPNDADGAPRAKQAPNGLASYWYGGDLAQCGAVASAMEADIVGVKEWCPLKVEIPLGGTKQSGIGGEGGEGGLREFLETQVVSMPKPTVAS